MVAKVDLDAYFQRIHWSGGSDPTLETLAGLIKAHTARIPFENLDVLLGRTLRLDLEGLQDKIVGACRGGYVSNTPACLRPCLNRSIFRSRVTLRGSFSLGR